MRSSRSPSIQNELRTILTDKDFAEVRGTTLLGESEKEVVDAVKGCLPASCGLTFDVTLTKIPKKLWQLSCAAAPKASGGSASVVHIASVDDDAPLPDGVPEAIEKAWVDKHGFHLSGARLLVGSGCSQAYKCFNQKKKAD